MSAILRLDKMPENCEECILSTSVYEASGITRYCNALNEDDSKCVCFGRRNDCPLIEESK
jgi:hypothetical protein